MREKLVAEANGLAQKAEAMKELDGTGREHEEFRLQLEKEARVELEAIGVHREIAEAQARMLAEAHRIDGFINKSNGAQTVLKDYLHGDRSLPADLKDVMSRPALTSVDPYHCLAVA